MRLLDLIVRLWRGMVWVFVLLAKLDKTSRGR